MWLDKTNKGKVVYKRKLHVWTQQDVERIVKAFSQTTESADPMMMSELADKVLFWIAEKLSLDEAAGFAIRVVLRIFEIIRGTSVQKRLSVQPITTEEQELLDWMSEMSGGAESGGGELTRLEALSVIRQQCSSMIVYIDEETNA
jgi:hypothetical protein